jgi:hypothetical protein
MAVELASSWCASDLGAYRPSRYTYTKYPLDSVPPVDDALNGFRWLGDRGQRHTANVGQLARIQSHLAAVGVTLPEDFTEFYSWDGWATELDAVSGTGCWTRLGPLPAFSPAEPGAFLVRFLNDQQDSVVWYLYLRRGEPAFVVHAYGLEFNGEDDTDPETGIIYRCASTFEEFAYRFWVENRIQAHLLNPDAGPLPPRLAGYLAHYSPPQS